MPEDFGFVRFQFSTFCRLFSTGFGCCLSKASLFDVSACVEWTGSSTALTCNQWSFWVLLSCLNLGHLQQPKLQCFCLTSPTEMLLEDRQGDRGGSSPAWSPSVAGLQAASMCPAWVKTLCWVCAVDSALWNHQCFIYNALFLFYLMP